MARRIRARTSGSAGAEGAGLVRCRTTGTQPYPICHVSGEAVPETNRQIRLAARPQGELKPSDWEHIATEAQEPGDGQFAGVTRAISLDPAMRGWLDDRPSYLPPV